MLFLFSSVLYEVIYILPIIGATLLAGALNSILFDPKLRFDKVTNATLMLSIVGVRFSQTGVLELGVGLLETSDWSDETKEIEDEWDCVLVVCVVVVSDTEAGVLKVISCASPSFNLYCIPGCSVVLANL